MGNGLLATPFTRLARVQAFSSFGDGLIAVALAGSIFFDIDPSAARWRVALYLVLTIAPFAVVTPLLGPAMDRAKGGRRGGVIATLAVRSLIALLMARHIDSLFLFPEAFVMLVMQKGYAVSRAALVPVVCPREEELIEANSKLTLISAISGVCGGGLGGVLVLLFSGAASTGVAVAVFLSGAFLGTRLPQVQIATEAPDSTEKLEVRGANIILAATATAVMRGIVGFTTFLLAFHLRAGADGIDRSEPGAAVGAAFGSLRGVDVDGTPGPPSWHWGVAGLAAGVGAFLGARYAPEVRLRTTEERMLLGALMVVATAAFLGAWGGGVTGIAVYAFGVGIGAAFAKLGFDALVQRDAPRSNHGRVFARFEGRFQLFWAVGAFIPVVVPIGIQLGALLVALTAAFAAVSYDLGRRTDRAQRSSRVRDALRSRVSPATVERLGSAPFVVRVTSFLTRRRSTGVETLDPTLVSPKPPGRGGDAVSIDQIDWGDDPAAPPEVSAGDDLWVHGPEHDPTVDVEFDATDGGQFRLWPDDPPQD